MAAAMKNQDNTAQINIQKQEPGVLSPKASNVIAKFKHQLKTGNSFLMGSTQGNTNLSAFKRHLKQ